MNPGVTVDGPRWVELADRVYLRRYREQALSVGLVVGETHGVVIDTRSSALQGQELRSAVEAVTALPLLIVNTHAHWDHCFGNSCFVPAPRWGHTRCRSVLEVYGAVQRDLVARHARGSGEPTFAEEVAQVEIVPPDHTFEIAATLDLGGRTVELHHLGRGHTDNDVVVEVVDTDVVFAGDLVEEGAPPAFEDSFPLEWPDTLQALAARGRDVVVPGHGAVVDRAFVAEQTETLAAVATLATEAHAAGRAVEQLVADGAVPLPPPVAAQALLRAYRQLDGEPAYDPPEAIRAALGLGP